MNKMINRWIESLRDKFVKNKSISYDPQLTLGKSLYELDNEFKYVRWFAGTPFIRYAIDTENDLSYWTLHERVGGPLVNLSYANKRNTKDSSEFILSLLKVYENGGDTVNIRIPNVSDACAIKRYYKSNGRVMNPFIINFNDLGDDPDPKYFRIKDTISPYKFFFDIEGSEEITGLDFRPVLVQKGIVDIFDN